MTYDKAPILVARDAALDVSTRISMARVQAVAMQDAIGDSKVIKMILEDLDVADKAIRTVKDYIG